MGFFSHFFGGREERWFKYGQTTQFITAYLYCTKCKNGSLVAKSERPEVSICKKCQTKTVSLLRPFHICAECYFAFPEIDYEMDRNGNRNMCPHCKHAEYNFRNKVIYLPDTNNYLAPEAWIEKYKIYKDCSKNKIHSDSIKKIIKTVKK